MRCGPNSAISFLKKVSGVACAFARAEEIVRRDLQEHVLVPLEAPEARRRKIRRAILVVRARAVIEDHAHAREAVEQRQKLRDRLGRHLQADGKLRVLRELPRRETARIVQPVGLIGHRAPGGEEPHAGEPLAHPVPHPLGRVGREHVGREHAAEPVRMRCDRIGHIRIVVAVAGRRLHEHRLLHARRVHGRDHLLGADGALVRPLGLMAADRRARIAGFVRGNDVGMDVDGQRGALQGREDDGF